MGWTLGQKKVAKAFRTVKTRRHSALTLLVGHRSDLPETDTFPEEDRRGHENEVSSAGDFRGDDKCILSTPQSRRKSHVITLGNVSDEAAVASGFVETAWDLKLFNLCIRSFKAHNSVVSSV
jgi:hypothetical protein